MSTPLSAANLDMRPADNAEYVEANSNQKISLGNTPSAPSSSQTFSLQAASLALGLIR